MVIKLSKGFYNKLILIIIIIFYYRHVRQLIKHSEEDESIMKQQEQDRKQFLEKAIVNYALCLKSGVSTYHIW